MTPTKQVVGVNENGYRVGESHPRAKVSDHDVKLMVQLHEKYKLGYRAIARKLELYTASGKLNWGYVRDVVSRGRRNQVAAVRRVVG